MLINTELLLSPNLSDSKLKAITGTLVHGMYLDEPIYYDKFADITYEEEFTGLNKPKSKVIKMAKKEHVDSFFKDGTLRLGTFNSFRKHENSEVQDKQEGALILVKHNSKNTQVVNIQTGNDYLAFCCFDGEADIDLINSFEYDSSFEIFDLDGFLNAIGKKLNSIFSTMSRCIYKDHKVLISRVPDNYNFKVISSAIVNSGANTKFFIKPYRFHHQNEFRFLWQLNEDITSPLIMKFPEARKFCKR